MFARVPDRSQTESFSKSRRTKGKTSFREHAVSKHRHERSRKLPTEESQPSPNSLTSSIITIVVGREQRLFAAHEDVLCLSPFFQAACRNQYMETTNKRITLPDEEPEIFSSILEYLYKGDYYPRLIQNKRRNTWELETGEGAGGFESTIHHHSIDGDVLKDTVIYCTAEKYGLDELKRVALRKQGLQSGIQCSTILSSARYAYANTPESDSKLRAHYLALIIRSRGTFKRSGTMQLEMMQGGSPLFFDLFVALTNHIDDVVA
ncbi:BTB POZ protein [Rutstroemia sp. NJR-2017a WRK4]|nr:BTB POZ protein [Rutstroemia sp. NJR-2017a WRK4]